MRKNTDKSKENWCICICIKWEDKQIQIINIKQNNFQADKYNSRSEKLVKGVQEQIWVVEESFNKFEKGKL
jgi:sulfur transfer protein SufE